MFIYFKVARALSLWKFINQFQSVAHPSNIYWIAAHNNTAENVSCRLLFVILLIIILLTIYMFIFFATMLYVIVVFSLPKMKLCVACYKVPCRCVKSNNLRAGILAFEKSVFHSAFQISHFCISVFSFD